MEPVSGHMTACGRAAGPLASMVAAVDPVTRLLLDAAVDSYTTHIDGDLLCGVLQRALVNDQGL